ncbi:MAG: hypothetical protein LUE87_05830 [Lachnospiraceae bacterium]|nr:hypothetical protein [Lachnospiraceae bacterium]MCD8131796.1 hypothetical protein [Lachnospiraceae bacterium]
MKQKLKRVFAVIGVILLAAMYLMTLMLAVFHTEENQNIFYGFVMLDIAVPVMLWILCFFIRHFGGGE